MKRIIILSLSLICLCCCSNTKIDPVQKPEQEKPVGFVPTGWNGYYVEAMAGAYDYFVENDRMPVNINVEGLNYNKGKYVAAGCALLKKMIAEPQTWQNEEVSYISASCPDNTAHNTLDLDVMTLEEFIAVTENAYEYAQEKKIFPNYCTVDPDHKDSDGSEYSTKMIINALSVSLARIFNYFVEENSLPETVSTWHSDFLRSVNNCPVDNETVISTMNQIIEGKTTTYDKAKALFDYVRDEYEWVNYANTRNGAVKTINTGKGNCCDLSHALVAMSRAAGIPARYRHAQCQYSSSVIGHVMAELYVDGVWYLCDPSSNNCTFGKHEAWSYMVTFNGRYNELPF